MTLAQVFQEILWIISKAFGWMDGLTDGWAKMKLTSNMATLGVEHGSMFVVGEETMRYSPSPPQVLNSRPLRVNM